MPGKQMAIERRHAGLIGEDEAKRRSEVTQEADFYGSMDGASKFVRGDAIAGILIMVISIGRRAAGRRIAARNGMGSAESTLLTIGDGAVAESPALVISTAAGVIVTRVSTDQDSQAARKRRWLVALFGINPGILMLLAAAVLGCAWHGAGNA